MQKDMSRLSHSEEIEVNKIAVLGASGHGKVVAELAELLGYSVIFFDDNYPNRTMVEHWEIIGTNDDLVANIGKYTKAFIAIGNNVTRQKKQLQLKAAGFKLPVLIHPNAIVSPSASIEEGTVIMAGAIVNSYAQITEGCVINTGAIIEHDCLISKFSHISPNATLAGGVSVGENSWVGMGSTIKQLINVGSNCIVGASSVVLRDLPDNAIAFGNPATVQEIGK